MTDKVIITRYAEAFIEYARETIGVERAVNEMRSLKINVLRQSPEFLEFLLSPEITHAEKLEFIDTVLADSLDEVRNFLKYLLEKGRFDKLTDIIEYIRVTYAHEGAVDALLRTAFPLDLEVIKEIEDTLERKLKQKFKFFIELDGRLLGGVQVVIGNMIYDGSVRKRLDDLREKLQQVRV